MANCHQCWWADFHDDSPTKHVIHEEPDYLQMKGPFSVAPMVRIVMSCGKGQSFYKTYGMRDHSCPKFSPMEKHQPELDAQIAKGREAWRHPTSRTQMQAKTNGLAALAIMQEGDEQAYNTLTDLLCTDPNLFTQLVTDLDDMNIRGEQIILALDYCESNVGALAILARERESGLVEYVNVHYSNSLTERAVERGAHLYGHKEITNATAGKSNTAGTRRAKRRSHIPAGRKIGTQWRRGSSSIDSDDT